MKMSFWNIYSSCFKKYKKKPSSKVALERSSPQAYTNHQKQVRTVERDGGALPREDHNNCLFSAKQSALTTHRQGTLNRLGSHV